MKPNRTLVVVSLLSVVLGTLHVAHDVVLGISPPGIEDMIPVAIFVLLAYATVAFPERPLGLAIMLLGGLGALAMPVLHLQGSKIAEHVASSGGFFFIWVLFALGTTGSLAVLLSAGELWALRPGKLR